MPRKETVEEAARALQLWLQVRGSDPEREVKITKERSLRDSQELEKPERLLTVIVKEPGRRGHKRGQKNRPSIRAYVLHEPLLNRILDIAERKRHGKRIISLSTLADATGKPRTTVWRTLKRAGISTKELQ